MATLSCVIIDHEKTALQRQIDATDRQIDQLVYVLYVKKKIAAGLKAADEGRVVSHEDVKKRLLAQFINHSGTVVPH